MLGMIEETEKSLEKKEEEESSSSTLSNETRAIEVSKWLTTSQEIVAPSLPLPSMSTIVSPPLFEKLCQIKHLASPLDYIDTDSEQAARQSSTNARVRNLLKSLKRPKSLVTNAAPEYINIRSSDTNRPEQQQQRSVPVVSTTYGINVVQKSTGTRISLDSPHSASSSDVEVIDIVTSPSRREVENNNTSTRSDQPEQLITPSPASNRHRSISSGVGNSPSTSARLSFSPSLGSRDPPWMSFLGYSTVLNSSSTKTSSTRNWKQSLELMNRDLDFFGRLHEEICALLYWLEPTPEELFVRQRVLARIKIVAQALWPDCEVRSFGSYYTGLWLPNGDLDICIMNVEGDAISNLRTLTLCLTRLGIPIAVEVISSARVPIVKFVDSESGVPVDISLNTDSALTTSKYVVEHMHKYPWLRPLILIVKLYLQQRNLNETYKGGIGSYLLFVICLSFLQQHRISSSPLLMGSVGMGHLLFDFLQLYGRDFNFDTTGLSVRNGGSYFPKTRTNWFNPEKPCLLSVESPLATDVDLGRNSYDIRTVRNCFRQSFLVLSEAHYDWQSGRFEKIRSILEHIIFPHDALFRNRVRFPIIFTGNSDLEKTAWWRDVKKYFDRPLASPRPPPILPKSIIEQVCADLEMKKPGGIENCVELREHLVSKKTSKKKKSSESTHRYHEHFGKNYDEEKDIRKKKKNSEKQKISFKTGEQQELEHGETNPFAYNSKVSMYGNDIARNHRRKKEYRHSKPSSHETISINSMLKSEESTQQINQLEMKTRQQNNNDAWD